MRIAHYFRVLVAVLFLAAVLIPTCALAADNTSFLLEREGRSIARNPLTKPWLHSKHELQEYLWKRSSETNGPIDCCPSVLEMVEPNGGTNRNGMFVQLYQNGEIKQRFYELSCQAGVANSPCLFMDRKLHNQSRCVQKFSYSYALVREPTTMGAGSGSGSGAFVDGSPSTTAARHHHHAPRHQQQQPTFPGPGGSGWMLDYIRVRSGCSCEVTPMAKKKRGPSHNKLKKAKNRKQHEDAD